jgi:outer membrane protein W
MKKLLTIVFFFSFVNLYAQMSVTLEGGGFFPVGEFADTYKSLGYGGAFTFNFISNSSMEIGLHAGYEYFEADEDALKDLLSEEISGSGTKEDPLIKLDLEAPLKIYPLTLNFKYYLEGRKWKPFFALEAGVFFYDLKPEGTLTIAGETYSLPAEVEKENSTMLAFAFGTKYKIKHHLYLVGNVKWSVLNNIRKLEADVDEKIKSIDKTVQTIGVLVGVNYIF